MFEFYDVLFFSLFSCSPSLASAVVYPLYALHLSLLLQWGLPSALPTSQHHLALSSSAFCSQTAAVLVDTAQQVSRVPAL